MIPATEKQTEIHVLSTFNNMRWAVFCGSSHKIYEPSRKSL